MKTNTKIRVGWYMNKHKKFDTRVGIFDEKSKEWISKDGKPCLTFFDTTKNRYTTAVNYIINEVQS